MGDPVQTRPTRHSTLSEVAGNPEQEDTVSQGSVSLCQTCDEAIGRRDATNCDNCGWHHFKCLEKTHVLPNESTITHSHKLYKFLEDKIYNYQCATCAPESYPLPLQLYEQDLLKKEDMEACSIEVAPLAEYIAQIDELRAHFNQNSEDDTVMKDLLNVSHDSFNSVVDEEAVDTGSGSVPPVFNAAPESGSGPVPPISQTVDNLSKASNAGGDQSNPLRQSTAEIVTDTDPVLGDKVPQDFNFSPSSDLKRSVSSLSVVTLASTQKEASVNPEPFIAESEGSNSFMQCISMMMRMQTQQMQQMRTQQMQTQQMQTQQMQQQDQRMNEAIHVQQQQSQQQMQMLTAVLESNKYKEIRDAEERNKQRAEERQHLEMMMEKAMNAKASAAPKVPSDHFGSYAKTERIKIPDFNGTITEWQTFWDIFNAAIHSRSCYTDVEKYYQLIHHLKGDAKAVIAGIPVTDVNYQEALSKLQNRYGDKTVIIETHIAALRSLYTVGEGDFLSLQRFFDLMESHLCSLTALHGTVDGARVKEGMDLRYACLIPEVLEKLPTSICSHIIRACPEARTSLSSFRATFEKQLDIERKIPNSLRTIKQNGKKGTEDDNKPSNGYRPYQHKGKWGRPTIGLGAGDTPKTSQAPNRDKNRGNDPTKFQQFGKWWCIFCNARGDHSTLNCTKFPTAAQRKKQLGNHCAHCLRPGHQSETCANKRPCRYCQKIHHSAICFQQFSSKTPKGNAITPTHLAQETITSAKTGVVYDETRDLENEISETSYLSQESILYQAQREAEVENLCYSSGDVAMQLALCLVRREKDSPAYSNTQTLLDTGSKRTYITNSLADFLDLKCKAKTTINICTFANSKPTRVTARIVDVCIQLRSGNYMVLTAYAIPQISLTFDSPAISLSTRDSQFITSLSGHMADTQWCEKRKIKLDFLIGNDYYGKFLLPNITELADSPITLLNTKLGWVPSGIISDARIPNASPQVTGLSLLAGDVCKDDPVMLEDNPFRPDFEQFWKDELMDYGTKDIEDDDDAKALAHFAETVKMEDNRVAVQWPYKIENPDLPTNYRAALRRFRQTIDTLSQNTENFNKYAQNFRDNIGKKVLERVTPDMEMNRAFRKHYIPHHAVFTPQKATTKMRIVFDASCKLAADALSLNECLLKGPNLLPDLRGLLIRFRLKLIALISDIEKAFLQVSLQENSRDVCRCLWLKDDTKPVVDGNIQILRFARVPFGVKPSPYMLANSVRHLLDNNRSPVTEEIKQNIYVDNVITGVETLEEAKAFYSEAKLVFQKGSFNLREWTSNNAEFISSIPEIDRAKGEIIKVLGVPWNLITDRLSVSFSRLETCSEVNTKRGILKTLAAVFDPLGLVSCLTIRGKIFMQKVWKKEYSWDDTLTKELTTEWLEVCAHLKQIVSFEVPRFLFSDKRGSFEIYCFCDASPEAYASLIYLKKVPEEKASETASVVPWVILSKSRICPKFAKISIPRLELMASVQGVQELEIAERELRAPISKRCLWTDSQCVLAWIKSTKPLKTFVDNRVKIIRNTPNITCGYVPTDQNPADLATKTRNKLFAPDWDFWNHGPKWLSKDPEHWPQVGPQNISSETLKLIQMEEKASRPLFEISCLAEEGSNTVLVDQLNLSEIFDLGRFSSLHKLLRVTVYVKKFIRRCRAMGLNRNDAILTEISSAEIKEAKLSWELSVQKESYPKLFSTNSHAELKTVNLARQLGIVRDPNGLLRCKGRLTYADFPLSTNYPKLLPAQHRFTRLTIETYHRYLLHAGFRQTLAAVRKEYWIPRGNSTARMICFRCQHCKKHHAMPYKIPEMPPLPKTRVTQSNPFSHTGLDYAGPFFCKVSRHKNTPTQKVWIALFTCMSIRAVHLEVVEEMSTEGFLQAFRRFVAIRGKPLTILSDNASQFKLADKILKNVERLRIDTKLASQGIRWSYIPEMSPWMGGFYERLIGITKQSLKKSIGRSSLTLDQFRTITCEVMSIVNQRPLIGENVSFDNTENLVITPRDFLCLSPRPNLPILEEDDPNDPEYFPHQTQKQDIIQAWKQGHHYLNIFWDHWRNYYLDALRDRDSRAKSRQGNRVNQGSPSIGDIVLIREDRHSRNLWPVGRITKLNISNDGNIRSAELTLAHKKHLVRPIGVLYPLETTETSTANTPTLISCSDINHNSPCPSKKNIRCSHCFFQQSASLFFCLLLLLINCTRVQSDLNVYSRAKEMKSHCCFLPCYPAVASKFPPCMSVKWKLNLTAKEKQILLGEEMASGEESVQVEEEATQIGGGLEKAYGKFQDPLPCYQRTDGSLFCIDDQGNKRSLLQPIPASEQPRSWKELPEKDPHSTFYKSQEKPESLEEENTKLLRQVSGLQDQLLQQKTFPKKKKDRQPASAKGRGQHFHLGQRKNPSQRGGRQFLQGHQGHQGHRGLPGSPFPAFSANRPSPYLHPMAPAPPTFLPHHQAFLPHHQALQLASLGTTGLLNGYHGFGGYAPY